MPQAATRNSAASDTIAAWQVGESAWTDSSLASAIGVSGHPRDKTKQAQQGISPFYWVDYSSPPRPPRKCTPSLQPHGLLSKSASPLPPLPLRPSPQLLPNRCPPEQSPDFVLKSKGTWHDAYFGRRPYPQCSPTIPCRKFCGLRVSCGPWRRDNRDPHCQARRVRSKGFLTGSERFRHQFKYPLSQPPT